MKNPVATKMLDVSGYSDEAISIMCQQASLTDAVLHFIESVRYADSSPMTRGRLSSQKILEMIASSIQQNCDRSTQEVLLRRITPGR